MVKISKFFWLFLLSFSFLLFTGCSAESSKDEGKNVDSTKSEINTELLQEQNDLYEKVCQDFSDINKKVVELNDKIHSMKGKLTDAQNKSIDEIEKKRASIHTSMGGLKKVSAADWETFKTNLENDISDVKVEIDEILNSIN